VEFLGWFGAVTVLAGYLLFSMGKLPNGPVYQLFNLVGGLAVAINVAAHHAIPSTIVNGIWAIVAVVVLVKMARTRRAAKRGAQVEPEAAVLHAEPAATTAVLPIIGPALRDHEPTATGDASSAVTDDASSAAIGDATDEAGAAPGLQAEETAPTPTAAAPMTESIPVITATIALALVAAAQEQHDQRDQRDQQEQHDQRDQQEQHEPQHAPSTPS